MKRRFSKKERDALFLAADGKSEQSGEPLSDDWHADHIIPWSAGGVTDVSNGQALNADENIRKSDKLLGLLPWQRDLFLKYQRSTDVDFMVAALPGGGKTIAALACAKPFLNGQNRKLIVVAPTSAVRKQWRDQADNKFGLNLQTKEFRGTLKDDFDGVVTTYASVASEPSLFRRLCAMHRCMVIFDEIHHAGDKSSWGLSIQSAFENASRRLCLSGTPFKHDGQKIPFLKINLDGFYHVDFPYDYPSALRDGVVREVSFHSYGGSVEVAIGEDIFEFHTDDDLSEDDCAIRLRGLLRSSAFTRGILKAAHEKLLTVRKAKPDAGALALCIDANHASRIAKLLEDITGEAPDIIVSDTELSTTEVDAFKSNKNKWIVAVRMVSEGVDIPRLMVLSYLTNTATELFFRQAVGRIVRYQKTDYDTEAYCFIPDDPRLAAHAAKIEEFQAQVIAEEKEDDQNERERNAAADRTLMEILGSSDAAFAGLIIRGARSEVTKALQIMDLSEEFEIPESKVAALIERLASRSAEPAIERPAVPLEERLNSLRRKCSKLAARVALERKVDPKDVHFEYIKIANIGQAEMTESQLEAKIQWLLKRLNERN